MPSAVSCCVATILLTCGLHAAAASDEAVPRSEDGLSVSEIRRAVEQLSSPDRATRVSVEQSLIAAGPLVLEALPATDDITDVAVRIAVSRIRTQLERRLAEESLQAGRITFGHGEGDRSIDAVLALTPEQAARLEQGETVEGGPYWNVVDAVGKQIGGWPDDVGPDRRLTFRDRSAEDEMKRILDAGAFRIAAGPVTMRPVAGRDDRRLVRVPLELRAEPRLRPLFVSYAASDVRLIDERNVELPPFSPGASYELPVGSPGETIALRLDFLSEGDLAEPLVLQGRIRVTIAAAEQRFAFALDEILAAPVEESRGGVTVRVRQARRHDDGTIAVEIAAVYDRGGPAFESHRTWVYHNAARLQFDMLREGSTVRDFIDRDPGFSTIAQSDGGVVLEYRFAAPPADAAKIEFVYEAPTRILDAPIDFAVKDLTVPRQDRPEVNDGNGGGR